jgi:uncharacterized protein
MTIRLFDVQTGFGGAHSGGQVVPPEALREEMDRLNIARALVRIAPDELDGDPVVSNDRLLAFTSADDRFVPCPVVLPSAGGDLPPEAEQIDSLVAAGAGAVCIRPAFDCWSLAPWASEPLLRELEARRLPVVCLECHVALEAVARLAEAYGDLPLIVAGTNYRAQRILVPLVEQFANVYLSIGSNFAVHAAIEDMVQRVGPERLLFGTGFPDVEAMPAVTQLVYADISDDAKQMIGAENIERLIEGVRR